MCFFIVYLLKIITSIIKANTIIVSTIKPNKSMYIISNKIASIIAPPPHSQHTLWIKSGKPHLLIFISYVKQYNITFYKNQFAISIAVLTMLPHCFNNKRTKIRKINCEILFLWS